MDPDAYCREQASASGSSFYYSFLFLPPERRRAITALYAYCRAVDDAVDEASDPAVAAAQLAWWSGELGRLYAGAPTHPVTRALAPHIGPFGIGQAQLAAILEGMACDLNQNRYLDLPALRHYCHLVAGVVGELSAGIFGERSPAVLKFARELGLALQLVNIVRDVGEDARRGRIYLPLDLLRRHGVSPADVLAGRAVPGFAPALGEAAGWARAAFARALAALPPGAWRAQRPGLIMGTIYATLLDEIERGGFHVLEGRTSLTPLRKFTLAWRTWTFGPPRQWPREPARP